MARSQIEPDGDPDVSGAFVHPFTLSNNSNNRSTGSHIFVYTVISISLNIVFIASAIVTRFV